MEKIFIYKSAKNHYTADACIVWCCDDRFSKLLEEFIKTRSYAHVDIVKIAGGAKDTNFILDQIAKSITLHHAPRVVLMMHSECGAYGGSTDAAFYESELKKASEAVRAKFPNIEVETVFADFEGLRTAEVF